MIARSNVAARLVRPSTVYRRSFLLALDEYHAEGDLLELCADALGNPCEFAHYVDALLADEEQPGQTLRYLAWLAGEPHPIEFEGGYVPQTTFWWVAGGEYLGRISIRHRLTPHLCRGGGHIGYEVRPSARRKGHATAMLAAVLPLAAELGVDPACLDCRADNAASRVVIERNGGRLQREEDGWLFFHLPTRPA